MATPPDKPYLDLAVIIPLEEELLRVCEAFPGGSECSTVTQFRRKFVIQDEFSLLMVQQSDMGTAEAAQCIHSIASEYKIGLFVCLGIAGGMNDDLDLGDVCYTGEVLDLLTNSRARDKGDGYELDLSPDHFRTPPPLEALINFSRTVEELKPIYERWQERAIDNAVKLGITTVPKRAGGEEPLGIPKARNGTVVCGLVSKSEKFNRLIRTVERRVLAIETESGPVFRAAAADDVPAITIRGISDYADKTKGDLEKRFGGRFRTLAADNAAHFLRAQFDNPRFLDYLRMQRSRYAPALPLQGGKMSAAGETLSSVLTAIGEHIDDRLRDLSPEYRLQYRGYRLPVPRVRISDIENQYGDEVETDPQDLESVLATKKSVYIELSKTYPDQSLPWVFARELMLHEYNGKPIAPIVLSGGDIRPPGKTLTQQFEFEGRLAPFNSQVERVYIIENTPLYSKSRREFIAQEISQRPDDRFIVINRDTTEIEARADFCLKTASTVFEICEVSFKEIAQFLKTNFEMAVAEAEVVALRLHETFSKFDLMAHPTYFAGIPRETLAALLHANRRSELIQLAVDGFLLLLVADDKARVTLSRTTRLRFLRRLAFEIHVEKRAFTEYKLIEFVQEIAKLQDFDVEPITFIHDFLDKGILNFNSGLVAFSLPD